MKVRAKSNRSQANWPAVTLLRYEEVAAAGSWMKEARPRPWVMVQEAAPVTARAKARLHPAVISSMAAVAIIRIWPAGPNSSQKAARASSRPAK